MHSFITSVCCMKHVHLKERAHVLQTELCEVRRAYNYIALQNYLENTFADFLDEVLVKISRLVALCYSNICYSEALSVTSKQLCPSLPPSPTTTNQSLPSLQTLYSLSPLQAFSASVSVILKLSLCHQQTISFPSSPHPPPLILTSTPPLFSLY